MASDIFNYYGTLESLIVYVDFIDDPRNLDSAIVSFTDLDGEEIVLSHERVKEIRDLVKNNLIELTYLGGHNVNGTVWGADNKRRIIEKGGD